MDCFDTILADANMQTCKQISYETLNYKFQKSISEIHENVIFCLQFPFVPVLVSLWFCLLNLLHVSSVY